MKTVEVTGSTWLKAAKNIPDTELPVAAVIISMNELKILSEVLGLRDDYPKLRRDIDNVIMELEQEL